MSYSSLYKIFVSNDHSTFEKIYQNRMLSESTIKLNLLINNYPAFIFLHSEIINLLYKIREMDKKVEIAFNKLPDVAKIQFVKMSLIQEIEMTHFIEGVISTKKEINDILEDVESKNENVNRIKGIVNKYRFLLAYSNPLISNSLSVRELYNEVLIMEIDKSDFPDGVLFRKGTINVYKNASKLIHKGITPESKIIEHLEESIKLLNDENIDMLIRVAAFHYLFGYIHPFYDGNGRINRLISSYYLSRNLSSIVSYRISMTIKENYSQYLKAFEETNDIRNRGDIGTFVYSFLELIYKSLETTEMYAKVKKNELDNYKYIISQKNLSKNECKLLFLLVQCTLFSEFGLSVSELGKILNKSDNTIRTIVNGLIKKGYVSMGYIGKRKFYSAKLENIK